MKVALLADTHGFVDPRIAACVSECDVAVHAGDVGGADVLLALAPRDELVAVRGNNDTAEKWSEGERSLLETLPRESRVSLPGGDIVVLHGDDGGSVADRHRRYRRRFPGARLVVYGHSHRLVMDRDDTPWIVNPGAAGRTRTHGGPSMVVLTCTAEHWHMEERRFEQRRYPSSRRRDRQRAAADSGHAADDEEQ